MSSLLTSLSPQQLRRAADLKDKIQSLENELHRILGTSIKPVAAVAPKKKRKMSAAARRKISFAAKARWAKAKGKTAPAAKPQPKRKISAAGIARIRAAQKARWAKIKAAKKS
jgi:hypothetical protein